VKSKFTGVAAISAFFGIVCPASADMVTVTYTGTVLGGFDQLGVFGTPNTSLTGDRYSAVYFFNTAIGLNVSVPGFPQIFGGTGTAANGQPSPALGALITISSHSEGESSVGPSLRRSASICCCSERQARYTCAGSGSEMFANAEETSCKNSPRRASGIGVAKFRKCSIASSENFSIGYLSKNDRTRLPERVSYQTNAPGQVSRHVSRKRVAHAVIRRPEDWMGRRDLAYVETLKQTHVVSRRPGRTSESPVTEAHL
jgi:hypothetical protein